MPTYVGISGAATLDGGPSPDAESTYNGVMASSGILVPNRSVAFADVTDGTSNTMMLGESVDFTLLTDLANRNDGIELGDF